VAARPFGDEAVLDVNQVDLTISAVGDAGLVELSGLTQLQELYLGGTQVSAAGVDELRKTLPSATIQHYHD